MKKNDYATFQKAANYNDKRFSGGLKFISEDELKIIDTYITSIHGSKENYLDLGTGTGRVLKILLKHHPKRIYALDQSEKMIARLKINYPEKVRTGTVKLLNANSDKIPLKQNSVDIATSLHLFKHLANIRPTIREVARVLKPKGHIIFDVLNQQSVIRYNLQTCNMLSASALQNILVDEKFKIKEMYHLHYLGETVYRLPGVNTIHWLDQKLSNSKLRAGTKILVFAQKT